MLLAILALLAAAEPFNPQAKGTVGLSFGFPGGGGTATVSQAATLGATYFVVDNLALRADAGVDLQLAPSGQPALFFFGVAVRSYLMRKGALALYLYPELTFARVLEGSGSAAEVIALSGGVGAEFFFADRFSIGGQIGVGVAAGHIGGSGSTTWTITTTTSGLFASVYF